MLPNKYKNQFLNGGAVRSLRNILSRCRLNNVLNAEAGGGWLPAGFAPGAWLENTLIAPKTVAEASIFFLRNNPGDTTEPVDYVEVGGAFTAFEFTFEYWD